MDLPDKQHKYAASVAKNSQQRHHLIIVVMMLFFVSILFLSFYFSHRTKAAPENNQKSSLSLPPVTAITNQQQARWKSDWISTKVKPHDTLTKIFKRNRISLSQLSKILLLPQSKKLLTQIKPGHEIYLIVDKNHVLQKLRYQPNLTTIIHITRVGNNFTLKVEKIPLEKHQAYSHGEIKASLFSAGLKANLPSKLIMQLVDIFQWDIDFAKNIRPGDSFDIIYEEQLINGESVSKGNILSAEFFNRGKKYTAIRFATPNGHANYYTETGRNVKRLFTRTPVKFTRISSYFKPKRWHPVLHRFRKHEGVDYAAPAGTPIKATGDGKISFMGRKGGYGNAVIISHGNHVTTLYGHMLRFAKHLHKNSKVKQGQVIGFVGMTGLATGFHCHYEFRINKKHHDPLKVKLPQGRSVPKKYQSQFNARKNRLMRKMATFHATQRSA